MPKPKDDPWKWRKCEFCRLPFKPSGKDQANARRQRFCCAAHQKEFWKHGAVPIQKLMSRQEKRLREIVREELNRVSWFGFVQALTKEDHPLHEFLNA
jgi:hypothetical protein